MKTDTVLKFRRPATAEQVGTDDPLTDLLRQGARKLIAQAVEAELEALLELHADKRTEDGQKAVVRNGYLPERDFQTGIGSMPVKIPKVRDRSGSGIKFNSELVPPYLRRTKSVETLLPWLYLKGISTGDFQEALTAILGSDAKGLSAPTIARLKQTWEKEHQDWAKASLAKKRYVYWWADGIHFSIRGENARSCILILIGVTETGHKEFVAIEEGLRESELGRVASEPESARFGAGARTGHWRRLPGVLEGIDQSVRRDATATVLGAQNGQRPQQTAQELAESR